MQILRAFRLALVMIIAGAIAVSTLLPVLYTTHAGTDKSKKSVKKPQQLVESIDFQGNRRLRDEDLLYYVQTRAGDTFSQQQIERDLQSLLALNFFDKTETRILTEDGDRGGLKVIFNVKELPIIRDLQFKGLKAVQESDVLKEFREKRIGISKEAVFDPVKIRNASRLIRELLSAKGYPNATVEFEAEEVSATSTAITFTIEQGERSRIAAIDFDGNQIFKDGDLRGQLKLTKKTGLITRFSAADILDRGKLDYDLNKNVLPYIRSKGYLQARLGEPQVESLGNKRTGFFLPLPVISSKDDTLKVTVPVTEGRLYKVGTIKIEGNSIFSEDQIRAVIGLQAGEIADGKRLQEGLFENLKKLYGSQGFIQYDAELNPELKDNPTIATEGIADFNIVINEGKQFTLRRLEFRGNNFTRDFVLRREFLINEGDVYNDNAFSISVLKLNQSGYFDPIDGDKDKVVRTDESNGLVDIDVNVKERGKQQISFNGGISGIGGSSFGLDYSTSNLFGRGIVLGLSGAIGNRQQSFSFSLTQPYFRDRPISVGVSLFG
ncbi:MAG: outer membrane protein assembly factor BamA, partial [Pyrinomonadaceae bacterium]|nr:outer membrane protein assembly factor BamA [Pyrinomonadaceae bacterium]